MGKHAGTSSRSKSNTPQRRNPLDAIREATERGRRLAELETEHHVWSAVRSEERLRLHRSLSPAFLETHISPSESHIRDWAPQFVAACRLLFGMNLFNDENIASMTDAGTDEPERLAGHLMEVGCKANSEDVAYAMSLLARDRVKHWSRVNASNLP